MTGTRRQNGNYKMHVISNAKIDFLRLWLSWKNDKLTDHVCFAYQALFVLMESAKKTCAEHQWHESNSNQASESLFHSRTLLQNLLNSLIKFKSTKNKNLENNVNKF